MSDVVVSAEELDRRIIQPAAFVADSQAFIDVRLPDSQGKSNFSMIGPGVSQNPHQHINVREPHGFNVGAAGMPAGTVNNQHLHYTAEVFVSLGGEWEFRIGVDLEQRFEASGRFVLSVPTWIYRGFRNIGGDDRLLYAVLGGDDTGGIQWSPKVLQQAAATGLYLKRDNTLLDTTAGDVVDETIELIPPMSETDVDNLRRYDDQELIGRLIHENDVIWSDRALLDSMLPGHRSYLAPIIGWGMTMDRNQEPPIVNPHTFTMEWLRVPPGNSVSGHRHGETQVLLPASPGWELVLNRDEDELARELERGAVVSVPRNAWRSFRNTGDGDAHMIVVNGGDTRVHLEWPATTAAAADRAGYAVDAGGYLAEKHLVLSRYPVVV